METTTLILHSSGDRDSVRRARDVLAGEPGVHRVLVDPDRGEIFVRHSRAKAPRARILEHLEDAGLNASIKCC